MLVKSDSVTSFTYVLPARRICRSKTRLLVIKLKILEMYPLGVLAIYKMKKCEFNIVHSDCVLVLLLFSNMKYLYAIFKYIIRLL